VHGPPDSHARSDAARSRLVARLAAVALVAVAVLGGLTLAAVSEAGPCPDQPRVPYGKVLRMWGDLPAVTVWNSVSDAPAPRRCGAR
jgi:hypothetical protein